LNRFVRGVIGVIGVLVQKPVLELKQEWINVHLTIKKLKHAMRIVQNLVSPWILGFRIFISFLVLVIDNYDSPKPILLGSQGMNKMI